MPPFFKAAAKFAGFAEEAALKFEHFKVDATTLSTTIKRGEELVGNLTIDIAGSSARVASSLVLEEGKGIGRQAYKAAAEHLFSTTSVQELTSDILHGTSDPARGMWGKLLREGVAEPVLRTTEEGIQESFRITRKTMERSRTAMTRFVKADAALNEQIIRAGAGHDNSSLLNRSMKTHLGSRKTSGAL